VSLLLHAGESVVAVAERIGDTPAMVLTVYGHILPGSDESTRKAIDSAGSGTSVAQEKASTS
jgi:hypothetical protein